MAAVVEVAVSRLLTPLHTPFVTALRRTTTLNSVLVRLTDDAGRTGFGEAPQVWRVTGESLASIDACVMGPLSDVMLAWEMDRPVDQLRGALDDAVVGNMGAKAACEVAAYDLLARRLDQSLPQFLGASATSVTTDVTVAADASPETTVRRTTEGFRHLKIKVGLAADDVDRVRRIHDDAGEPVRIRVDANQGWDFATTVAAVEAWLQGGVDLEFVEQPLHRSDLRGHAALRKAVPVPVMLDESVFSTGDLDRVLDAEAADMINIKLAKCGGLHAGIGLAQRALDAGLGVMVGSMLESRVGVSAAASLAAAIAPGGVHDLDAAWWSVEAPTGSGPSYSGDQFLLPTSPGLDEAVRGLGPFRWIERTRVEPV